MSELFCYSTNEELYYGSFGTREEAIAELKQILVECDKTSGWVGKRTPPVQPELLWSAEDDWLEMVGEQDDYRGDFANDWDDSTKEQREELEKEVRAVMAAWLDRHNLRPKFFCVDEIEKVNVEEKQSS